MNKQLLNPSGGCCVMCKPKLNSDSYSLLSVKEKEKSTSGNKQQRIVMLQQM